MDRTDPNVLGRSLSLADLARRLTSVYRVLEVRELKDQQTADELRDRMTGIERALERSLGIKPSLSQSRRATTGQVVTELRCGDVVLPLCASHVDLRSLLRDVFDVSVPSDAAEEDCHKTALRRYMVLEGKAAKGALDSRELRTWKKICSTVDRAKAIRVRELHSPRRALGQIVEDEGGPRTVRWSSDLVLPVTEDALESLRLLEPGEWFEANVRQDANGRVISLQNIDIRSDYSLASDHEIEKFFEE